MSTVYQDITGVILAGGKSRRFGQNKAFARFHEIPFIQKILHVMRSLFSDVWLVTNTPEEYFRLPVKILVDKEPYQGPLGGIVTALEHSPHAEAFVVACDMPLLHPADIREIIEKGRGWDAAVPIHGGQAEYLMALYSKRILPKMEWGLRNGVLSLRELCRGLDSIGWIEIAGESAFNVNTAQDLRELEERYAV